MGTMKREVSAKKGRHRLAVRSEKDKQTVVECFCRAKGKKNGKIIGKQIVATLLFQVGYNNHLYTE